jgi:flavin reductase (DIM6/NTAB) family NADH-FMN oxidoreductase RutF
MEKTALDSVSLKPFQILDWQWALLVGGKEKPNPMTVSWGGFGTLWHKPVVTVYVRPTRHTFTLLNEHPEFTLNFLPEKFRPALSLCGEVSGRDVDKWQEAKLTPQPSEVVAVPRVAEAEMSIECRVLAWQDFDPARFVSPEVEKNYPNRDYHRIFWGEVLRLWR